MKPIFAYASRKDSALAWQAQFAQKAPEIDFQIWPDISDPASVRYLAAWQPPADIGRTFPNLEVLFSVGAGVDQFDLAALPKDLPIVRMIEPSISDGMAEYVTMSALALRRDLPAYLAKQRMHQWQPDYTLRPERHRLGILGFGVLSQACLEKLRHFNFDLAVWTRTRRETDVAACFAGQDELAPFLARTEILVCLLPLTPETRGMIDKTLLSQLPHGARLIHVGRGEQLDTEGLVEVLSSGAISAAVLDVTNPEPLPAGHALWSCPNVFITPHIASVTNPATAVDHVLTNLRLKATGQPMIGLVDRARGY